MEHAVAEYAKLRVELEDTKARAEVASRVGTGYMAAAERAEAERDGAYRERAHLVALLAAMTPGAVIAPALDIDEPGWWIAYLTIGGRQCSWHISPRDATLFGHVEHVTVDDPRAQWDGHSTEEKYAGIAAHTAELEKQSPPEDAVAAVKRVRDAIAPYDWPHAQVYVARVREALDEPKEH